jgi:hypothetical protein
MTNPISDICSGMTTAEATTSPLVDEFVFREPVGAGIVGIGLDAGLPQAFKLMAKVARTIITR